MSLEIIKGSTRMEQRTELNLKQKLSEYERMIDSMPVGIAVTKADEVLSLLYLSAGTYELMEYTPEEHHRRFKGCGIHSLHPDDARTAGPLVIKQIEETGAFSVKARLAHKKKDYIWVHLSGRLRTDENEGATIYIVIVDISDYIELLESLQNERELMKTALELTDDALFDYDIPKRAMRYSLNFAERFGISSYHENFPDSFISCSNMILEEDAEAFRRMVEKANMGRYDEKSAELRFREPDGTIGFFSNRYRIIFDRSGVPVRVMGKLTDITQHKEQVSELLRKTEKDPLTGLYNKTTTEALIREVLKMRRFNDDVHALMILDADNFKQINDTLGHMQGDVVLKSLAEKFSSLFRSDDIVGRIGGDEFFVFVKNYSSASVLVRKAHEICKLFHETHRVGETSVETSVSIGIALCPQDATTFEELYTCADKALYATKARGKDNFCFFDSI